MKFQHLYAQSLPELVCPATGESQPEPQIIALNEDLIAGLGWDVGYFRSDEGLRFLLGQSGAHAMAYSGHQFGHFSPVLGDGRALLLGNHREWELHAKGTGRTPFSRPGSDGRAGLGPMLKEYIISEALFHLGVPTTRTLAVISTGRTIMRERPIPGAVMVRVARSHVRVGTFQYAAMHNQVRKLADFAISHLYPGANYQDFFRQVVAVSVTTVAKWQKLGFIHGVMNTDNTAISGESIDFGPCAFMQTYDPDTVFSSIDSTGRYRFGQQPHVLGWNLARFIETLLPLLDDDADAAYSIATELATEFPQTMSTALAREGVRPVEGDITLANHRSDPNAPVTVPRNIPVHNALKAAENGDLGHFFELLEAVRHPYDFHPELSVPVNDEGFVTFCGT
ncbi:MAG: protein adenylyltransferase SelO family protein [Corynebacterium sp.]|nr:protein adenylyltransferase SelO family protein [Corynebacterium sp.]